jgi:hypothetical protein
MHDGENARIRKKKVGYLGAAFSSAYYCEASCSGTAVHGY